MVSLLVSKSSVVCMYVLSGVTTEKGQYDNVRSLLMPDHVC